jgi:hypothetical protein
MFQKFHADPKTNMSSQLIILNEQKCNLGRILTDVRKALAL